MEYGLIGEKLGHSYSKQIHGSIDDYDYVLKEIDPEDVADFMAKREFKGINVTIPYKQTVIPMLDEIDGTAKAIGAVNTVVNRGGKLKGYNTDSDGMKAMILKAGMDLRGSKVLILGTGGTSKTANFVAGELGAAQILTVSRSEKVPGRGTHRLSRTGPRLQRRRPAGCPGEGDSFLHGAYQIKNVAAPEGTAVLNSAQFTVFHRSPRPRGALLPWGALLRCRLPA